jgi:hypothetical protein
MLFFWRLSADGHHIDLLIPCIPSAPLKTLSLSFLPTLSSLADALFFISFFVLFFSVGV